MRPRSRVVIVSAMLVVAAACGSSPSAPSSPALSLAGSWSGTWQFVTAGATVTDAVTANLTQSGSAVSGPWTAASGATGQLNFTAGSTVSGTMTITQSIVTTCSTAAISLSGTATTTSLDFTLAPIPSSGTCQWPTGNHFVFRK
jgi:hypothetical protein